MSDLATRLREVIEERLRVAREASGDPWVTGWSQGYQFSGPGDVYAIAHDGTPARIAQGTRCGPDITAEQSSAHIALNDPADAILARVRDLGVLELHAVREFGPSGAFGALCEACSITEGEWVLRFVSWPCTEIRAMATRFRMAIE